MTPMTRRMTLITQVYSLARAARSCSSFGNTIDINQTDRDDPTACPSASRHPAASCRTPAASADVVEHQPASPLDIQCHAVCATKRGEQDRADALRDEMPVQQRQHAHERDDDQQLRRCSRPTLNARSDTVRWRPANCSVSRISSENPRPCTSPKTNASSHRRFGARPACSRSPGRARHGDEGVHERRKPEHVGRQVERRRECATRCATVNAMTVATSGRRRRNRNDETGEKEQVVGAVENVAEAEPRRIAARPQASAGRGASRQDCRGSRTPAPSRRAARTAGRSGPEAETRERRSPVENCDASDWMGYSNRRSSIVCCQTISVLVRAAGAEDVGDRLVKGGERAVGRE